MIQPENFKIKSSVKFFLLTLALSSCNTKKPNEEPVVVTEKPIVSSKPHVVPPEFNSDSAFAYVKAQADMGPRVPGSKAHEKSVDYFKKQFKKFGAEVTIQTAKSNSYDNKTWLLKNVIASINPASSNRILLTAHYDSRPMSDKETDPKLKDKPCPGVNDGASGAGVLLEVARILQQKNTDIGVDIILFDLEDYGKPNGGSEMADTWCLGSQYWCRNPHKQNYTARFGILLDMVGAKDAMFAREGYSVFYANDIIQKVWKAADACGSGKYFHTEEYGEITDDHYYINKITKIPCIDILDFNVYKSSFFEYHHTTSDDLNTIDKNTLKGVGQTLLEVIYNEN